VTAILDKTCQQCGTTLARRGDEKASAYNRRRYCDRQCADRSRDSRRGTKHMEPRTRIADAIFTASGDHKWMGRAACRGEDPELFFADDARSVNERERVGEARAVCGPCPVRRECLRYALATKAHGIWAGTTRDQRDTILKSA
jgi:WhiB family redox-sensing transcriptional regulator